MKYLPFLILTILAPGCAFNSEDDTPVAANVSAVVGGRSVLGVEVDILGRRIGAGVWLNQKKTE